MANSSRGNGKVTSNLQELTNAGLRPTFSRMSVLSLFSEHDEVHLSAEEIHQKLQATGFRMGLATVYRVLTQFEQAGLLYRHRHEDGRAIYELAGEQHHDHMICINCKKMIEFNDPIIEERKRKIVEDAGYSLHGHVLYLYISCDDPNCPGKQNR
ncbi:MAG: ferric iron uptake transcriptional regulator [Magnetococcales bacterium]|nr:ferric iron uptake transcriptional regulator [Magnetococcales bacterium]